MKEYGGFLPIELKESKEYFGGGGCFKVKFR